MKVICGLIAFSAVWAIPVQAKEAAAPPLPSIVQKYVSAVAHLASQTAVSVKAVQIGSRDRGAINIEKPNKIRIVSRADGERSTLIDDGKNLWQWDRTHFWKAKAPAHLVALDPALPIGAVAEIAVGLLTDSTAITDYTNLRDLGAITMNGIQMHKVVSIEDGDTATFWLATTTGLPLQAAYTGGRQNRVVALRYTFPAALPSRLLAARPPAGLAFYKPSPKPKLLAVGKRAPEFKLPRASQYGVGHKNVSLSSLQGKVVLIDFWASWCRPCKKTMPHIQHLRETLENEGLTVLSINTWDQMPRMAAFLKRHPQYTSTFLFDAHPDKSIASSKYHVWGIPTVYIIDQKGNVAGAFIADDPKAAAQIKATLAKLGLS